MQTKSRRALRARFAFIFISPLRARRARRKTGYVLLTVLAVMVLMVTALATLSKLSLRRALAAVDAQIRLQQRVGADSVEAVLLPSASRVFDLLEKQAEEIRKATGEPVPVPKQVRGAVTFGGVTFDVVIADEDAKLNLNQVYHMTGRQRTESAVGDLIGPFAARVLRLTPATRPIREELMDNASGNDDDGDSEAAIIEIPRAFRSWGEVFDLSALTNAYRSDAALPNMTTDITCWGGGGLNVRRASDESVKAAAACVLSDAGADRLISRYRESEAMSLEILVQREGKTASERDRLRRMLAETSTHFSLWIDASAPARRSMRTFSVMRKTDDGIVINERFAF